MSGTLMKIETSDGSYTSPSKYFPLNRRLASESQYAFGSNIASAGPGVINAVLASSVVLKGCNFRGNKGVNGGVISLS